MTRLCKKKFSLVAIRSVHINENGAALIIGLMFLAILALVGSTAMVLTSTDLQIGGNYKTSVQCFSAAQAGMEEARFRLSLPKTDTNYAGDPATTPNPTWSHYISSSTSFSPSSDDPDYNSAYTNNTAASLQSDMPYLVKIKHKREYDAEQAGHTVGTPHYSDNDGNTSTNSAASPGSIVYYGYGHPTDDLKQCQFTGTGGDKTPVEIITAYGRVGGGVKAIQIEVRRALPPPIKSTIYAKDTVTFNGASGTASGIDNCGVAADKPPLYVYNPDPPPSGTTLIDDDNGTPTFEGDLVSDREGSDDIDISAYVNSMKGDYDILITSDHNSGTFGSNTDYVTCYCNADNLHPTGLDMRNLTGYGILLVEGDLILSGGFTWYGLILCTGEMTLNGGGGGVNLYGAALANQTVEINGGLNLHYDSCEIANSFDGQSLKIITWSDMLD